MINKTRSKAHAPSMSALPFSDRWSTMTLTTDDRLLRIQALGKLIDGHIEFMCSIERLNDSSAESRENAVAAFHEYLVRSERELARIRESLQLA